MWKTLFNHLLRDGLMLGRKALDESDGTGESGDVAFEYSLYEFSRVGKHAPTARTEIWVDNRRLVDTFIDGQAAELFIVFNMFHGVKADWVDGMDMMTAVT